MSQKRKPQPNRGPAQDEHSSFVGSRLDEMPETDRDPDDEEDSDFEEMPYVVVARLRDLGDKAPRELYKQYGDRPIWFLMEDDDELVGLFDRIPEGPLPSKTTQAILGAIRQFAASESDALQEILGVTDSIGLGFHASASLDEVIESFEDDGFEVVEAIEGGEIHLLEDEDEALSEP